MLDRFEDTEHDGYYYSDADQATPITRTVSIQDDATPAAFPLAIIALQKLASLAGEIRFHESADRALARAKAGIDNAPMAFASTIRAMAASQNPRPQLIIRGQDRGEQESLKQWAETHFPVNCYLLDAAVEEKPLPGILAEMKSDEAVTAWLCLGMKCLPPVHSLEDLKELMEQQG